MFEFFERLFGENARPVRRTIAARITADERGEPLLEPTEGETVTLSEDGSIDRVVLQPESFYHCGHSAALIPVGGRCAEPGCRQVSCRECFQRARCDACDKPLCLEHTYQLEDKDGKPVGRFCRRCFDPRARRRLALATARALLSPFHEDLKRRKK